MIFGKRKPEEPGPLGERLAAEFLRKRRFKILRRNCRSQLGEIDLIAREGDEVIFVEVKTRTGTTWGDPELAVSPSKQRKLSLTALAFAEQNNLRGHPLRFDVVAIVLRPDAEPEITHYPNAFPLHRSVRA